MGTSHVSVSTKIVKATWIAALVQWCLSAIGLTNSVHPYCRLAIIAMQMMPITSCPQRKAGPRSRASDALRDAPAKAGMASTVFSIRGLLVCGGVEELGSEGCRVRLRPNAGTTDAF